MDNPASSVTADDFVDEVVAKTLAGAVHKFYHLLNSDNGVKRVRYPNGDEPYKAKSWRIDIVNVIDAMPTEPSLVLRKQKGVSMSQALKDFVNGPTVADCWVVVMIAQLHGLKCIMGQDNFDRFFAMYENFLDGELISFWQQANKDGRYGALSIVIAEAGGASERDKKGHFGYFPNYKKYSEKHPKGFHTGEHVACIGKRPNTDIALFMGFGSSFKTLKSAAEINDQLFAAFNIPPTNAARNMHKDGLQRMIFDSLYREPMERHEFDAELLKNKNEFVSYFFDGAALKKHFFKPSVDDENSFVLRTAEELQVLFEVGLREQRSIVTKENFMQRFTL